MSKTAARKTCDLCGTPAARRYPVRIGGTVAMVGSSCVKHFHRANRSDLIRSLYPSDSKAMDNTTDASDANDENAIKVKGVLLAKKWTNEDPKGWWMSEKLDGVRAIWNGKSLISRLGNRFNAPKSFTASFPRVHLDGELFVGRGRFQETVSIVKSQADKGWSKIRYRVFDLYAPTSNTPFEERQKHLRRAISKSDGKAIQIVPQIKCKNAAHLKSTMAKLVKSGAEGVMLRESGSVYEPKRSSTLLKVKHFHDAEAIVIGYEPGKGKHKGVMGAVVVRYKNVGFKVGSGFADAERKDHNRPKLGTKITFRYQDLTDSGVPRFPTFVSERTYE